MPRANYRRRPSYLLHAITLAAAVSFALPVAFAQDASIPAGAVPARPAFSAKKSSSVSEKQAREAEDAYMDGVRQMEKPDFAAAERSFAHAAELNPNKPEYALSRTVAREHHLTELVQMAAKARLLGDNDRANSLLAQARTLDPDNDIVTQHLGVDASPLPSAVNLASERGNTPALAGPIEFTPLPGRKDLHHQGGLQDIIRSVYSDFGISVNIDSSFTNNAFLKFNLDNVDFATARRVLGEMTHTFSVAVEPKLALIVKDTPEDRDRMQPMIEETVYLPGLSNDAITEMANLARNVFGLKKVTASATGGDIVLQGDESTLRALNATYADMLDGGSDVLLDIHMYEVDKTHLVNIGTTLPSSLSIFPIVTTAQNILNSNQSVLAQAVASGILKLTGSYGQQELEALEFLIGSGVVSSSQFTNILGTVGLFDGLPLLGVSVASGGTFDLLLNSGDVRTLDDMQIRASDHQEVSFRAGTRYPVITATYSSGVSSSLASSLAGISVNGTSAASLLAQLGGGSSSVNIPQVQYEDLGITLKATPQIQHSGDVSIKLDLKIEALGSGTIDSIPILNNRTMTSTISIPSGKTALLASEVSRNEVHDIEGIPGLSELPGFQGTDKSAEVDSGDLLITITPHVVRTGRFRVTSRRLLLDHASAEP
jgi:general secretion pathway protein D